MCILGIPVGAVLRRMPDIFLSVRASDILSRRAVRFRRNTGRIRSQIGNDTDRSLVLEIDAFIQLLRNTHGFRSGKAKDIGRFLLQGTGRKRKGRLLSALTGLYLRNPEFLFPDIRDECFRFLSGGNRHSFISAIELGSQRLFLAFDGKVGLNGPILGRNKLGYLLLPLGYHPEGNRLDTACRQSPLDLFPQNRTDLIAHQAVQDTARLLCIHQVHIQFHRALHGRFDRIFRDLIKFDALHLLRIQIQRRDQMP